LQLAAPADDVIAYEGSWLRAEVFLAFDKRR
jgi:hypothetical protein